MIDAQARVQAKHHIQKNKTAKSLKRVRNNSSKNSENKERQKINGKGNLACVFRG